MHELGYILCKLICHLREIDPFLNIAVRVDFSTSCTIDFWESVVGKDCMTEVDTSPWAPRARDWERCVYSEL